MQASFLKQISRGVLYSNCAEYAVHAILSHFMHSVYFHLHLALNSHFKGSKTSSSRRASSNPNLPTESRLNNSTQCKTCSSLIALVCRQQKSSTLTLAASWHSLPNQKHRAQVLPLPLCKKRYLYNCCASCAATLPRLKQANCSNLPAFFFHKCLSAST